MNRVAKLKQTTFKEKTIGRICTWDQVINQVCGESNFDYTNCEEKEMQVPTFSYLIVTFSNGLLA
jgi:hypothetical protein